MCLQINKDECTATATQHATELASANQANTTMESQMQTLLTQVQALQLANTSIMDTITAADTAADVDAVPVGIADAEDHHICPLQSISGPTETVHMAAKDANTLPTDTRRMRPSRT